EAGHRRGATLDPQDHLRVPEGPRRLDEDRHGPGQLRHHVLRRQRRARHELLRAVEARAEAGPSLVRRLRGALERAPRGRQGDLPLGDRRDRRREQGPGEGGGAVKEFFHSMNFARWSILFSLLGSLALVWFGLWQHSALAEMQSGLEGGGASKLTQQI